MDPGHQINCFNRRIMAQALLRVLADTDMLAMKTQTVWWSLQGSALALLDKALARQRQDLLDGMTPLARRVRALSSDIVIDHATLNAHARIVASQPKGISERETLRQLLLDHQKVAEVIRCARTLAATLDDNTTLSLLELRLIAHESAVTQLEDFFSVLDERHDLLSQQANECMISGVEVPA
jgi:starvation-inducible DNA-binding protein